MANTLLIRPRPAIDESVRAYILRLADRNEAYNDFSWLLANFRGLRPAVIDIAERVGWPEEDLARRIVPMPDIPRSEITSDESRRRWSQVARFVDPDEVFDREIENKNRSLEYMYAMDIEPSPWVVDCFDQPIPCNYITGSEKRVCPHCLAHYGRMYAAWELIPVTGCPIHACQLLRECKECGNLLQWGEGTLWACRCGASLLYQLTASEWPERTLLNRMLAEALRATSNLWTGALDPAVRRTSGMSLEMLIRTVLAYRGQEQPFPDDWFERDLSDAEIRIRRRRRPRRREASI